MTTRPVLDANVVPPTASVLVMASLVTFSTTVYMIPLITTAIARSEITGVAKGNTMTVTLTVIVTLFCMTTASVTVVVIAVVDAIELLVLDLGNGIVYNTIERTFGGAPKAGLKTTTRLFAVSPNA